MRAASSAHPAAAGMLLWGGGKGQRQAATHGDGLNATGRRDGMELC